MRDRVLLIRHGQSEGNVGLRSVDVASIPLTPLGIEQAALLAGRFHGAPSRIVVSPFLRTQQTSAATRARFPHVPVEMWPVEEFTYLSNVHCRNTTSEERRPLTERFWGDADPDYRDGDDAESFRMFVARVDAALARLAALPGESWVFTHGQFMQVAAWRLGDGPQPGVPEQMAAFRRYMRVATYPNTAVRKLARFGSTFRLGSWDADHLAGLSGTH